MKCKYVERNQKENKCQNYYWRHSNGDRCMCRLPEWKEKFGVCPYDSSIKSCGIPKLKGKVDKFQKKL